MTRRIPGMLRLTELAEATAVLLFFYQALRVLFSALFGVIYDALFAEIVPMSIVGLWVALVCLAFLSPLAAPKTPSGRRAALLVGAVLTALARIPMTLNVPQGRLVASILIVAAASFYVTVRLRGNYRDAAHALVLALVVDQGLRAAGHTWDVTLRPAWLPGQIIVSVALCALAGWLVRHRPLEQDSNGIALGLSAGLFWGGWLFLETSLLNFPNAMARWASADYVLLASTWPVLLLVASLGEGALRIRRGWPGGAILTVLLLGGLAVAHLTVGTASILGLIAAQVALLGSLFSCLAPRLDHRLGRLGPGLSIGGLLFLILSFAYAFAFTYPYTLELFRNMGLPIVLLAGLLAVLPALSLPAVTRPGPRPSWTRRLGLGGACAVSVLVVFLIAVPRQQAAARGDTIRIATYNIHYGFDIDWHLRLEAQAQALEAAEAGIVALQEVDTGRPTSYMIDDALWLARRLGMEAVYLPTVEHLTGIALLSRYPVLESDALLLPSELEQTGLIWAKVDADGTAVNAFAIWMGLEPEERARQLDAALPFIAAHPGPAVFGGDFNSTPDSSVYARVAAAGFVDPFAALDLGSPPTDPAVQPTKRIDFVWLRGLTPVDARVSDSLASDHRLVVVEAEPP